MIELLKYIFSGVDTFLGTLLLILAFRPCRTTIVQGGSEDE